MKEKILNRILDNFPSDQPITAIAISTAEIPPSVRHFLLQALSQRVSRELDDITFPDSGWIDSSADLYTDAFIGLKEVLGSLGQIPSGEVETYFGRAINIVVSYLNDPVETLVDFLFIRDASTTKVSDVERRINYFKDHAHLCDVVLDTLQRSANTELDRTDLHERLVAADRATAADYSAAEWAETLLPLCNMYIFGNGASRQFPLELPVRFIEARGPVKLAKYLRTNGATEGSMIDTATLTRLLQDAFRPPPPPPSPELQPSPGLQPSPESPGTDLPLWKQYTGDAAEPVEATADPEATQPLWKTYASTASDNDSIDENTETTVVDESQDVAGSEPEESPTFVYSVGELEVRVLGRAKKLRDRFIRDLFKGDELVYNSVIEALAESSGWTDSAEILKKDIFVRYRIDIYSESAIAFTNAVEQHIKQYSSAGH